VLTADGSFLAGSIARAAEIDRTIIQTPRAVDNAQAQLASESKMLTDLKRTQNAEQLRRDKVRHERDERRRHMERDRLNYGKSNEEEEEGPSLDLVA